MTADTRHLMSVSLGKIAQARAQRGGMKLHHSLLVATVLHKARSAFMEETLKMVDSLRCPPCPNNNAGGNNNSNNVAEPPFNQFQNGNHGHNNHHHGHHHHHHQQMFEDGDHCLEEDEEDSEEEEEEDDEEDEEEEIEEGKVNMPCLDSFTRHRFDAHASEFSDTDSLWGDEFPSPPPHHQHHPSAHHHHPVTHLSPAPPVSISSPVEPPLSSLSSSVSVSSPVTGDEVVTIFDLDTRVSSQAESALCDITNDALSVSPSLSSPSARRKRVRDEVEEAVSTIIPKKAKGELDLDLNLNMNMNLNLDGAASEADMTTTAAEFFSSSEEPGDSSVQSLTNLVSIFSFKSRYPQENTNLARSVSTPDLCASQVFHRREEIKPRTAIAMTV